MIRLIRETLEKGNKDVENSDMNGIAPFLGM
jgi:hypothetical protein